MREYTGFDEAKQLPPGQGQAVRKAFKVYAAGNTALAVVFGVVALGFGGFVVAGGDLAGLPLVLAGINAVSTLAFCAITLLRVQSAITGDRVASQAVHNSSRSLRTAFFAALVVGLALILAGVAFTLFSRSGIGGLFVLVAAVALTGSLVSVHSAFVRLDRLAKF